MKVLGLYLVSLFGQEPTFWDYLRVPFSGSRGNPGDDVETLKMGHTSSPKTLVPDQTMTLASSSSSSKFSEGFHDGP